MKKTIIFISISVACLLIVLMAAMHFYKLADIPYGYHVDEYSGAVTIGCLATEGTDAHRIHYPLFADLHYGTPKPPTYIYPAILWAKVFGYSVFSLRALSVTAHLIGIVGIFFLARVLFNGRYAVMTTLVASISPWLWISSRVALESLFAVTFLIWGLYFFLKPANKWWRMALAGLLLASAMYAYPPTRLQVPLLLFPLFLYARHKNNLSFNSVAVFMVAWALPLIPLVQKTLSGEVQGRFNSISIFAPDYLKSIGKTSSIKDVSEIFFNNYFLHLKPDFLFLTGDFGYVHSTRHFGILSWLDMAALGIAVLFLLLWVFKKIWSFPHALSGNPNTTTKYFLLFLIINIAIGLAPTALTSSELPNALRTAGAWPFMCLFSGFLLWKASEKLWFVWPIAVLTGILFASAFLKVYFQTYPQESKGMFSYWTLEEANSLKTESDWLKFMVRYRYDDYHTRYYLMQYRKIGCSESKTMWDNLRLMLTQRGQY